VGQVLDGRRRQVVQQIDQCDRAIRVRTKALEALEGYGYEVDAPAPVGGLNYDELLNLLHRPPRPGGPAGRKPPNGAA
jgi:hypothetical protein